MKELTQERLKELVSYNRDTGEMLRKSNGKECGRFNKKGVCVVKLISKECAKYKLVFLYVTGSLPTKRAKYLDGDRANFRFNNLVIDDPTIELTQDIIKSHIIYNQDTGKVTGIGLSKDITINRQGIMRINSKPHYVKRLIWMYMTGMFPRGSVMCVDGDLDNLSWSNLTLVDETYEDDLSLEYLKATFKYNQDTGDFIRISTGLVTGWVNDQGYKMLDISNRKYRTHRLAYFYMMGYFPDECIDHINGIRSDNRWSNLREVTKSENSRNSKKLVSNTSGVVGVTFNKANNNWVASIKGADHQSISLGSFQYIKDAENARRDAEKELNYSPNHGRV